jgi:hypothetical protein
MSRSIEAGIAKRSNLRLKGVGFFVAAIVLVNFLSETVHGILTHELGTEFYAPLSVGEMTKGLLFVLLVGYALANIRYRRNRYALTGLFCLVGLVLVQSLWLHTGLAEIISTTMYGMRALYLFFVINAVSIELSRRVVEPETFLKWLKRGVFLFYCVPIVLAALGIAGYARLDRSFGFTGFMMNQNSMAAVMVCMAPFFFRCKTSWDYMMLFVYLVAAALLGARAAYIGVGLAGIVFCGIALLRIVMGSVRVSKRTVFTLFFAGLTAIVVIGFVLSTPLLNQVLAVRDGLAYMGGNSGEVTQAIIGGLAASTGRPEGAARFLDWATDNNNWLVLLFGGGETTLNIRTELDWVDLTVTFGAGATLMFYGIIGSLLWRIMIDRKRGLRFETFMALLLVTAVSLFAGHTFVMPATGTIVGCVVGAFFSDTNRIVCNNPVA